MRKYSDKLRRYGEDNPKARHSAATVERARQMHDAGRRRCEIARELGVPYFTVGDWIYYRTRVNG